MKSHRLLTFCLCVLLSTRIAFANQPLPTRDQTPLLQSYFIPAQPVTGNKAGWSHTHSLYITNTYQLDDHGSENLIIDVENTRYDLQLNYIEKLWHFNLNLSLISNRGGFLDQNIEGWHDFFGLPQGGRDKALNDKINLFYEKSGNVIVNSQQESQGLGDIQLAAGYQVTSSGKFWFALELPSSSSSNFISNQSSDIAIWYSSHSVSQSEKLYTYGSAGVVIPANDGLFKDHLNDQFVFAQLGLNYDIYPHVIFILQADYHSPIVSGSDLDALGQSMQAQFGLRFLNLFEEHALELFFSEDIFPGHAPDITFGLRFHPLSD